MATYLNSDTNTPLNFSESLIVLSSSELTLSLLAPDGILDVILPAGEYTISSDLEDNSYVPSVIFVLDETINLSIADGSIQNTISLDPILLRGLEISHGDLEAYALIGEGTSFTFYLKNLGESSEEYDIYVHFSNEAQSGWSSTINPVHVNIMSKSSPNQCQKNAQGNYPYLTHVCNFCKAFAFAVLTATFSWPLAFAVQFLGR